MPEGLYSVVVFPSVLPIQNVQVISLSLDHIILKQGGFESPSFGRVKTIFIWDNLNNRSSCLPNDRFGQVKSCKFLKF